MRLPFSEPSRTPLAIGDAVIGQAVPVARIRPLAGVEHQRRILDGARHRPDMGDIAERRWRIDRHPAEGRLQPDNAAEGGRDADRAAGIGADRERADAGQHGDGAAAAAAAGRAFEVPRVAGDPAQRRVGHRLPAEFGCRRLAEEYRALAAQPRRDRRILVPVPVRIDRARARPAAASLWSARYP